MDSPGHSTDTGPGLTSRRLWLRPLYPLWSALLMANAVIQQRLLPPVLPRC
jgi:hypothetical protein